MNGAPSPKLMCLIVMPERNDGFFTLEIFFVIFARMKDSTSDVL
jgi:hypothetical protein